MTVSFYLPKEIDSVIDKVVSEGNTKSPNYISSAVVSPSILKRNLVVVENAGFQGLDLNIVPLKLPLQHSTGNILKARSFDYDFIVSNTKDVKDETVFVLAAGCHGFRLKFKEKTVTVGFVADPGTNIGVDKLQHTYIYDVVETFLENTEELIDVSKSFKISSFKNTEDLVLGEAFGSVSTKVLKEYDIPSEKSTFTYDPVTKTVRILVQESVDAITDKNFKDTTLLFSSSSDGSYSNLRLVGGVTYQPVLNSFYTNKTVTEDIPNLRDSLDALGIKGYLGYAVILKPYEGLLFNYEIGTTSTLDYTLENIPNVFDIDNFSISDGDSELFIGQSFLITAPEIVKVTFRSSDNLTINTFEGGSSKEWYSFFKDFGIHSRILTEDGKVTKLYLNRFNSEYSDTDFTFDIFSTTTSTLQTSPNFREIEFDDFGGINNHPEKLVKSSLTEEDEDLLKVKRVVVSRNIENKDLKSSSTYLSTKQIKAIKFSTNTADSLTYTDYTTNLSTYTYTAEVTGKLKAYGFETLLEGLSTNLETNLSLQTVVDLDRGIVHLSNMTTLLDNLYVDIKYSDSVEEPISYVSDLKTGPYNLVLDSTKSLVSGSEALLYLDHTSLDTLPTISNDCSNLILDLAVVDKLALQPYAYRVLTEKVEEQDVYTVDTSLTSSDSKLKDILKTVSPFFTSITPLYLEGALTTKVLIQIEAVDVDNKPMKNILLWTDELKDGFIDGYDEDYQALTGYLNGSPIFTDISPELNSSLFFEGKYVSLNSKYGNSNYYSTNMVVNIPLEDSTFTIKVEDVDGLIEEQIFNVTSSSTLDTIIAQSTLDTLLLEKATNNLKISLASTETKPRLKVSIIKDTSTLSVVKSGLVHEDDEDIIVMLNKG